MQDKQKALPPFPRHSAPSPQICKLIRLYLAVEVDLSSKQREALHEHLQLCPECRQEQSILKQTSNLLAGFEAVEPSAELDQTILRLIQSKQKTVLKQVSKPLSWSKLPRTSARLFVIAALLLVFLMASGIFWQIRWGQSTSSELEIPGQLAWNHYVLYSEKTLQNAQGEYYQLKEYYDFTEQRYRREFVQVGKLNVVIVKDNQQALGLDLMHQVAQKDVQGWDQIDMSYFDLDKLRQDLATGKAVYEKKEVYHEQDVYAVHTAHNATILLDMQYMPVNLVEDNKQAMMYDQLQWLPPSSVSPDLWNMQVPEHFSMGSLPIKP